MINLLIIFLLIINSELCDVQWRDVYHQKLYILEIKLYTGWPKKVSHCQ